jgi:pimeloyl-ACP methyl ester carboxylesterase
MRGIEEVHIQSGVGKFISGQKYAIWKPPRWRGDGTKPLVSLQHGTSLDGYHFLDPTVRYIPLLIAGMYGLPVIAGDQDGAPNAGTGKSEANDASQANAWSAITQAQTLLGTKSGVSSVVLFGSSMGSHLTWCLHRGHQSEVTHSVHGLSYNIFICFI